MKGLLPLPASRIAALPMIAALLATGIAAAQVAPVELASVERRDIVETLRLTGSLSSPASARLSPDVEGRIVSFEVDAGARVKKGDLLFRLDDELARIELRQAIAAEHEAEADLADARRRVVEVRNLVAEKSFPESEARSLESLVQRNEAVLERRRAERALHVSEARYRELVDHLPVNCKGTFECADWIVRRTAIVM